MGDEIELSHVEQTILRYADSESPESISARLGGVIEPSRVAALGKRLLAGANWLTQSEQEDLVIRRMRKIVAKMEGAYQDLDTQKAQIQALGEIAKRLDKRREATAVDLEKLYGNQAQIMLRAVDLATGYLRGAFREKIDQENWDAAIREGMALAAAELEKHEAVEQ